MLSNYCWVVILLLLLNHYLNAVYQYQTLSYLSALLITDIYIYFQSIFFINELIIYQNAKKKHFSLHYLEKTRSFCY